MKYIPLIFISFFAFACSNEKPTDHSAEEAEPTEESSAASEPASPFDNSIEAYGNAVVPPNDRVTVFARTAAFVRDINVLEGRQATKGELLLTLESPELIDMQQNLRQAAIRHTKAKAEMERGNALVASNALSDKAYQTVLEEYNLAAIDLSAMEKKLSMLGFDTERIKKGELETGLRVVSPAAGLITDVLVNRGQRITESTELFRMTSDANLYVEARLQSETASALSVGMPCTFERIGDKKASLAGAVEAIIQSAESGTNTMKVRCRITEKSASLIPGERVLVKFDTRTESSVQ